MLGIATAVYQRKDVFRMWAKNVKHCFPDAIVSVAYSEMDYKQLIEGYGFNAVWHDNKPLGHKFNAAIKTLQGECDRVIITGSDDIVSDNLADFYHEKTPYNDYIGFFDCYFYSANLNRTKYWGGYTTPRRMGEPIGAGKMVSNKILNELEWQPFPAINKSLDWHFHNSVMNLTSFNIYLTYLTELKNAFLVDIKNEISMNKFDNIPAKPCSNSWQKFTHYVELH